MSLNNFNFDLEPASREQQPFRYTEELGATVLLGDSSHHATVVIDESERRWIRKGHDVSDDKARNEVKMLAQFAHEGVPTLTFPRGQEPRIERSDDGAEVYLPFVEGLQPLTRVNWEAYAGDESYAEATSLAKRGVELAAKMHKRGFVHGDFQIKNTGQLPSGKIITFDLENAAALTDVSEKEQVQAKAEDLESYCKSLLLNGFLQRTSPAVVAEEVDNLLMAYVDKGPDPEASFEVASKASERVKAWSSDPYRVATARARFTTGV